MATSFPYLSVARAYGVDYWRVLAFAELLDERPPVQEDWALPHLWMVATCLAYKNEMNRRMEQAPKTVQWSAVGDFTSWKPDPSAGSVKISVQGDCGVVHDSVAEWRECSVCASIIRRRMEASKA